MAALLLDSLCGDYGTRLQVGLAIAGDARKIHNDYSISVESCEDLSVLAKQKLGQDSCWSLASLTENLTHQEVHTYFCAV